MVCMSIFVGSNSKPSLRGSIRDHKDHFGYGLGAVWLNLKCQASMEAPAMVVLVLGSVRAGTVYVCTCMCV